MHDMVHPSTRHAYYNSKVRKRARDAYLARILLKWVGLWPNKAWWPKASPHLSGAPALH